MRAMAPLALLSTALSFALVAVAQQSRYCPGNIDGLCYSVNIPASTASSGNGDIFFQISAPSSLQWAALGEGTGMSGSNIFVIYANDAGDNVTLSPRSGRGHFEPEFNSDARVTLLSGSGISNGKMTANVKCSNCQSWDSGKLNVKDTSSNWIWAAKEGDALKSSSTSAEISFHDDQGTFSFDLSKAAGGSSANPFVQTPASSPDASATGTTPAASSAAASSDLPTSGYGDGSSSSSGATAGPSASPTKNGLIAHGVLMGLAVVVFLPLGALTLRLFAYPNLIYVHVLLQLAGFATLLAGFGVGVWLSTELSLVYNNTHTRFGTAIVALFFLQPILGLVHHGKFKRTGKPSAFGIAHKWYGRALLVLAVINGGLGLQLANNSRSGEIAYGVVSGVIFVLYVVVVLMTHSRSNKQTA